MERGDPTSAELVQGIVDDARQLVRLELDLAKQELRELLIRNAWAAGLVAVGAVLLLVALLVALPVFIVLLWDNHVLGAAIWLGALVLVGGGCALVGTRLLRLEAPRRTLASLEETKQWGLRLIKSNDK